MCGRLLRERGSLRRRRLRRLLVCRVFLFVLAWCCVMRPTVLTSIYQEIRHAVKCIAHPDEENLGGFVGSAKC